MPADRYAQFRDEYERIGPTIIELLVRLPNRLNDLISFAAGPTFFWALAVRCFNLDTDRYPFDVRCQIKKLTSASTLTRGDRKPHLSGQEPAR